MAAGATHVPAKLILDALNALLGSASVYVAIITNAVTPNVTDSFPCWGAGGAQDYSTAEAAAGGGYVTGGFAVSGFAIAQVGATININATSPSVSFASNASNPTGLYYAVYYDNAASPKRVLAWVELGTGISSIPGLNVNINASGSGTQPIFHIVAS
jgi:hypothetical protein